MTNEATLQKPIYTIPQVWRNYFYPFTVAISLFLGVFCGFMLAGFTSLFAQEAGVVLIPNNQLILISVILGPCIAMLILLIKHHTNNKNALFFDSYFLGNDVFKSKFIFEKVNYRDVASLEFVGNSIRIFAKNGGLYSLRNTQGQELKLQITQLIRNSGQMFSMKDNGVLAYSQALPSGYFLGSDQELKSSSWHLTFEYVGVYTFSSSESSNVVGRLYYGTNHGFPIELKTLDGNRILFTLPVSVHTILLRSDVKFVTYTKDSVVAGELVGNKELLPIGLSSEFSLKSGVDSIDIDVKEWLLTQQGSIRVNGAQRCSYRFSAKDPFVDKYELYSETEQIPLSLAALTLVNLAAIDLFFRNSHH